MEKRVRQNRRRYGRERFTLMNLTHLVFLRDLIGAQKKNALSDRDLEISNELLRRIRVAISAHEERMNVQVAE